MIQNIQIYIETTPYSKCFQSRIYLYAGGKESKQHLPNAKRLEAIIREKMVRGHQIDFKFSVNLEAQHAEVYWREEFPKALKWLFY